MWPPKHYYVGTVAASQLELPKLNTEHEYTNTCFHRTSLVLEHVMFTPFQIRLGA